MLVFPLLLKQLLFVCPPMFPPTSPFCVLTRILTYLLSFYLLCFLLCLFLDLLCATASAFTQICLSRGASWPSHKLKFWCLTGCFHPLLSHLEPAVTGTKTTPLTYSNLASYVQYRNPLFTHQNDWVRCSTCELFRRQFCPPGSTLIPSDLPTHSLSTILLTHWTIINDEDLAFQNWTYHEYQNEF